MHVNADSLLIRAATTSTSGTLNDLTTDLSMANNNTTNWHTNTNLGKDSSHIGQSHFAAQQQKLCLPWSIAICSQPLINTDSDPNTQQLLHWWSCHSGTTTHINH